MGDESEAVNDYMEACHDWGDALEDDDTDLCQVEGCVKLAVTTVVIASSPPVRVHVCREHAK